jgi:hypothetical protein
VDGAGILPQSTVVEPGGIIVGSRPGLTVIKTATEFASAQEALLTTALK